MHNFIKHTKTLNFVYYKCDETNYNRANKNSSD